MYTLSRQPSTALANSGCTKHLVNKFLFTCSSPPPPFSLLFCAIINTQLIAIFLFHINSMFINTALYLFKYLHHTQKAWESINHRSSYMCTPSQNKAHPVTIQFQPCPTVSAIPTARLWTQVGLHWLLYISTSARDYILFRYIHCVQVRVIRCHL